MDKHSNKYLSLVLVLLLIINIYPVFGMVSDDEKVVVYEPMLEIQMPEGFDPMEHYTIKQYTRSERGGFDPQSDVDYLIITDTTLWDTFNDNFKNWKIQNDDKISSIVVVNVSDIISDNDTWIFGQYGDGTNSSNGNPWIEDGKEENNTMFNGTQCKIRNFIRKYVSEFNTEYVLLGGNKDVVPPRMMASYAHSGVPGGSWYNDTSHAVDMYYACLNHSFNNNTNSRWGENTFGGGVYWANISNWDEIDWDYDVLVGRVLVNTVTEAERWINKTKNYLEEDAQNYSFSAMVAAKDSGNNIDDYVWGEIGDEFPSNISFVNNQNISQAQWNIADDYCNGLVSGWGGIGLIHHSGHGGSFWNPYEPSNLDNSVHPNFLYTEGCHSADFGTDTSSRMERWISDDGGVFLGIANSAYGWFEASTWYGEEMFNLMFNETTGVLERCFARAHFDARENIGWEGHSVSPMIFKETNFFGDPAMEFNFWDNFAPEINDEYPADNSTDVETQPVCQVNVTDADNDSMDVFWYQVDIGDEEVKEQQTNRFGDSRSDAWQTWNHSNPFMITAISAYCADTGGDDGYFNWSITNTSGGEPSTKVLTWHYSNVMKNSYQTQTFYFEEPAYIEADTLYAIVKTGDGVWLGSDDNTVYANGRGSVSANRDFTFHIHGYNYSEILRETEVVNGTTIYWHFTNASEDNTTYHWKVAVNDSLVNTSKTFNFTTGENITVQYSPAISNEYPADGSIEVENQPTCHVDVNDLDNDTVEAYWYQVFFGEEELKESQGYRGGDVTVGEEWQTFNHSEQIAITYVNIHCSRGTSSGGYVNLSIRNTSGGVPSTDILASCHIPFNNLPTSHSWETFTFDEPAIINPDEKYAIYVWENSSASFKWYICDSYSIDRYPNGRSSAYSNRDFMFAIYGENYSEVLRENETVSSLPSTIYWDFIQADADNTTYHWKIAVNDSLENISEIFSFTTGEDVSAQFPPNEPENETPTDESDYEDVYDVYLNVTVSDPDGDDLNVSFYWGNDSLIVNTSVANNSVASCYLPDYIDPDWLDHDTTYEWYVNVSDATNYTVGPLWNFKTCKAWDLNVDRTVNYLDASLLVSHYLESVSPPGSESWDINNDGICNYLDISSFVAHYLESY